MLSMILFSLAVALLVWYWTKNRRKWKLASKISGPRAWPILGNVDFYITSTEKLLDLLMFYMHSFERIYRAWIGPFFYVVIYDPVLSEKVLNNHKLKKSNDYAFLKPWVGTGLLTSAGSKWFSRRKAITPAFHFKILEDFVDVFSRKADVYLEKFKKRPSVDIYPLTLMLTLDIVCESAMGTEIHAQTNKDSDYVLAFTNITRILFKRMFNPFLYFDAVFKLTSDHQVFVDSLSTIHQTLQKVIDKKRKNISECEEKLINYNEMKDEFGRKKKMALLDLLLTSTIDGKPLTDSDIHEEVNTFMFAGPDTSATAIAFLLYNLAKHHEIQERVYQEVTQVFGKKEDGTEITLTSLNDLKYTELVIKESMRLFTPVPFVSRRLEEDVELEDEIKLPEGTQVNIFMYGLCHHPKLFPDPFKFDPERFNDLSDVHPFTYTPFSAGPRNCIAQRFAMIAVKTVAVKVLQNFKIYLVNSKEPMDLVTGMILKPRNGIFLRFEMR